MKKICAKYAALLLAGTVALGCFAGCGSSDSSSKSESAKDVSSSAEEESSAEDSAEDNKAVVGDIKSWGIYTVLVPNDWTLRTGDVLDDNDERYCSVKKSDFSYFDFKCETEELQQMQYNYNKNTYTLNQKDIPATKIGGIEWNGFEYGNELTKGFELYGTSSGRFLRVSCAGFAFDSAEAKAIFESLSVTAAPSEDTSSEEESSAADDSSEQNGSSDSTTLAEKASVVYNGITFNIGDKLGNFRDMLGDTAKESIKMQPCVPGSQEVELVYYPGLTLQVNYEDTVISVSITEEDAPGRDAALSCGLKLGDDRAKAKSLLGEPDEENEYALTYNIGDTSLMVYDREKDGIYLIGINNLNLPF